MNNHLSAALLAGLSSILPGCRAGDAPADATFSVRDSAGIEIVESVAPAWEGEGWRLSAEPSVVIGRVEGDERYLFGEVAAGMVLRDGRIAVVDEQSALVRVYSPEGVHLEDWGGRGEGPGEFTFPGGIFPYRGDSVLVSEWGAGRLTIFDGRGRFGRSFAPEMRTSFMTDLIQRREEGNPSLAFAESCCRLHGPLPTGAFLLSYPELVPTTGRGMKRGSVSAAITADSGGPAEPAGVFQGKRYQLGQEGPSMVQFDPWFNMAAGPGGYVVAEGDAYSISAYDASGRLRRIIRLARDLRPVTDEIKAAHEDRIRERISAPGAPLEGSAPEEVIRGLLSAPYPSHLPTFAWLHVDPEGNVWAGQRSFEAGADENEYHVFGADGGHLGVVDVPADLWVFQIGADFILGRARDALGVDYVQRYAIEK